MTDLCAADPTASANMPLSPHDPSVVREVAEGLRRRELPPKFFYDDEGSRLFERITRLPEYYLTRTEAALLRRWMPSWMADAAPRALVELGAGSGEKTRIVLDAVTALHPEATYVPVDVSAEFLDDAARAISADYPTLSVVPVVADITAGFALPPELGAPVLHAFLGSTIGNFPPGPAVALLRRVRGRMRPDDRFLMGVDLRKDPAVIEAAYNDAEGVTAAFNRNMLHVVNDLAGADFRPEVWAHRAAYDPDNHWVEIRLVPDADQVVMLADGSVFHFAAGEGIRTEISSKHDRGSVDALFAGAGLRAERWETDDDGLYALTLAAPA